MWQSRCHVTIRSAHRRSGLPRRPRAFTWGASSLEYGPSFLKSALDYGEPRFPCPCEDVQYVASDFVNSIEILQQAGANTFGLRMDVGWIRVVTPMDAKLASVTVDAGGKYDRVDSILLPSERLV